MVLSEAGMYDAKPLIQKGAVSVPAVPDMGIPGRGILGKGAFLYGLGKKPPVRLGPAQRAFQFMIDLPVHIDEPSPAAGGFTVRTDAVEPCHIAGHKIGIAHEVFILQPFSFCTFFLL
jgi:hypothetical protein